MYLRPLLSITYENMLPCLGKGLSHLFSLHMIFAQSSLWFIESGHRKQTVHDAENLSLRDAVFKVLERRADKNQMVLSVPSIT